MEYVNIVKNPVQFLSATSLNIEEFKALHEIFSDSFLDYMKYKTLDGKTRQRSYRFRSNSIFKTTQDMLLFILNYLKNSPLQESQALSFNTTQPKANIYIHLFIRIMKNCLQVNCYAPLRKGEGLHIKMKELGLDVCYCDGTEREITRSVDYELQKEYYSGKSKMHAVKNNVISDDNGTILHLSQTFKGKTHDKKILDESEIELNKDTYIFLDTGFIGYHNENAAIVMPSKKRKGIELTEDQKAENKRISSDRVRNEHVMSGIKRLRIVKDKLKVWAFEFEDIVMEVACGLHNFRLQFRPWNYPKLKTNLQNYIS